MKSLGAFFLFVFSTISCLAQSANYQEFSEDYVWRVDQTTSAPVPGWHCSGTYHYDYQLLGDTLFQSKVYRKLFRSDIFTSSSSGQSSCFIYGQYGQVGYAGAIYEDTLAGIVYYLPLWDSTEYVLYDYNLVVGDTINSYMLYYCDRVITSIDTVNIDGIDRRRWHYTGCLSAFTAGGPEYYIEGLGSSHGLIESTGYVYMRADLICVKKDSSVVYETGISSAYGCSGEYAEIESIADYTDEIQVFPNPVADVLKVANSFVEIPLKVQLLNGLGQLQEIYVISNNGDLEIDVSNISHGVYFLTLSYSTSSITRRIIVSD